MISNDEFYQVVSVTIELPRIYSPGEFNRILKGVGATLDYDVYSFYRKDKIPIWQSEVVAQLRLFLYKEPVDAQEKIDKIEIDYPLATIDSSYINDFARLVEKLSYEFSGIATLKGAQVTGKDIISYCDRLSSCLMESWGEEPGSKNLRIMIESMYKS